MSEAPHQPIQTASPASVGDIVAGKYRVERILGAGGMGVVVLATHLHIQNRVALKFLRASANPGAGDYVERFLREARAAGRLTSEHVARVHDAGTLPDGTPYIAMEYVEGSDLGTLLDNPAPILVPDAVEYVLQAAEALMEAHGAGIVHRDLKPQNLLLGRRLNGSALVKVLDFGIAKAIGGSEQKVLTDSSVVLGSPLYMSPEQMRGHPVDARSDQWSLGVILYQLLTRRLPFDGQTVPELCLRVMTEEPVDVAHLAVHVPPDLAAVVHRCLQKEVAARFTSVAELAAHLEPFSRSRERGVIDRPWRSFADTMDSVPPGGGYQPLFQAVITPPGMANMNALDATRPSAMHPGDAGFAVSKVSSAPVSIGEPSSGSQLGTLSTETGVTWGAVGKSVPVPRRKSFLLGTLLGSVLVALVAGVVFWRVARERESAAALAALPSVGVSPGPASSAAPGPRAPGSSTASTSAVPKSAGSGVGSGQATPTSTPSAGVAATSTPSRGRPPGTTASVGSARASATTPSVPPSSAPAPSASSSTRKGANGAPILPL
jgi:serine/threonine-protein kinase